MYFWRIAHLCLQLRSSTASWCRASFVSQRSLCGNAFDLSISLSLFISPPSFSLWFHNTCHLMLFTQYSLLDQFYFCTSCLFIIHFKFTNKIHQLFTDYLLRLPYSELLETHLFRSRANRRLVSGLFGGGRRRFYRRLCTRASLQNAVRDTSHPQTRTSRIESVLCDIVGERNSEHGFVELGWNSIIE